MLKKFYFLFFLFALMGCSSLPDTVKSVKVNRFVETQRIVLMEEPDHLDLKSTVLLIPSRYGELTVPVKEVNSYLEAEIPHSLVMVVLDNVSSYEIKSKIKIRYIRHYRGESRVLSKSYPVILDFY